MSEHNDPQNEMQELLNDLAATHMPFGKYGPGQFPPQGIPLYDLPYEYLAWFQRKGFPKGKLGRLMQFVYLAKRDGADAMFDPLRARTGGRSSLRHPRRRTWTFPDDESTP